MAETSRTKDSVDFSAASGVNGQRGTEWWANDATTAAPVEAVFDSDSSYRPCVTHISGHVACTAILRIRAGADTTMWISEIDSHIDPSFQFNFSVPLWGVSGLSLVCEISTDAGASMQRINAAGFSERVL